MVTYYSRCATQFPNLKYQKPIRGGIFFDRDGTIIEEKNYLRKTLDLKFYPDAMVSLKKLSSLGLPMYIFTNQAGVAHGLFNEETLNRIHLHLVTALKKAGVNLRGIFYCPHHPQAEIEAYRYNCSCRKPNPGLLNLAARLDRIDLPKSYVIGDKLIDLAAGKRVGAKTVLVLTGYGTKEIKGISPEVSPDFIGSNLAEVVDWIITDQRKLLLGKIQNTGARRQEH